MSKWRIALWQLGAAGELLVDSSLGQARWLFYRFRIGTSEIKTRAKRRLGELLIETGQTGQRAKRGGDGSNQHKQMSPRDDICSCPTLADLGITKCNPTRGYKPAVEKAA